MVPETSENPSSAPLLTLSAQRVEVRLYCSTRTSSDYVGRPPHFSYCIRCDWCPAPASGWPEWWDFLPPSYTIRRRRADLEQLHQSVRQLAFDSEAGCQRVKAKIPTLPQEGELDHFVAQVASTGDAGALSRQGSRLLPTSRPGVDGRAPLEELDELHRLYMDNHLRPYFADVTKVLSELPKEVIRASTGLRKFVSQAQGVMLPKSADPLLYDRSFLGPPPLMLDPGAAAGMARRLRELKAQGIEPKSATLALGDRLTQSKIRLATSEASLPPIAKGRRAMSWAAISAASARSRREGSPPSPPRRQSPRLRQSTPMLGQGSPARSR